MPVGQARTDILKQRLWPGCLFKRLGQVRWLVNLIQPIGLDIRHHGACAATPQHLKPVRPGWPRRKNTHRVVAAEVPAAGDHFLRQDSIAVGQADARADAGSVATAAAQPHRHPWPGTLVAVQPNRLVQVVDDHVLIAVVVEVGQRHAVRNANVREPPLLRGRFKFQVADIAKGRVGAWPRGAMLTQPL